LTPPSHYLLSRKPHAEIPKLDTPFPVRLPAAEHTPNRNQAEAAFRFCPTFLHIVHVTLPFADKKRLSASRKRLHPASGNTSPVKVRNFVIDGKTQMGYREVKFFWPPELKPLREAFVPLVNHELRLLKMATHQVAFFMP